MADRIGRQYTGPRAVAVAQTTGTTAEIPQVDEGATACVHVPSDWDGGTSWHFEATYDGGTTWLDIYDEDDAQVSMTVAAGRSYALPPEIPGAFERVRAAFTAPSGGDRTLYFEVKG